MAISATDVKELRERSGAGMLECKQALETAGGDLDKAMEALRAKGHELAAKRGDRETADGLVQSYIHHNSRVGALVEVNCESDFVARTDDFKALVTAVALQVAATNPQFVSKEDMPADSTDNPKDVALLEQPFFKDESQTIGEMLKETIGKTGENIRIRRFARFELGR